MATEPARLPLFGLVTGQASDTGRNHFDTLLSHIRDRGAALTAVVLLHAVLLLGLASALHVSRVDRDTRPIQVRMIQRAEAHHDAPPLPPVRIEPTRIEPITAPFVTMDDSSWPNPVAVVTQPVQRPVPEVVTAVTPPQFTADYLTNPAPPYPAVSRRLREEGVALLRVRVTPEGRAAEVQLERTSGFSRLDSAALAAVKDWRFVPARRGQERVEAWVLVPIEFALRTR